MIHGDGQIEICYTVKPDSVLFQCYNGCGNMEELEVGRVFERFYKADVSKKGIVKRSGTVHCKRINTAYEWRNGGKDRAGTVPC